MRREIPRRLDETDQAVRGPLAGVVLRGQAEETRVLRGGAFNNNQRNVRCAYRNRNNGFRVVVSHNYLDPAGNVTWRELGDRGSKRRVGAACSWPVLSEPKHRVNIEKARPLW